MSLVQSGLPPTDYYAPNYSIEVEEGELDPETKGDVLEVKVVMDIENLTSFDIKFNNWDDRALFFKYSDTDTLDVGQKMHIQMGYADRLVSMVRGIVTTLTPNFPESGSPTISVGGNDSLFCLKDSKPKEGEQRKYTNMRDWEIAEAVARRHQMLTEVTKEGPTHELVVQKNQDDAQFLMERAKRIDFDVFVQTDPESRRDKLHFVKPTDGREAGAIRTFEFEWGTSLISFSPRLSLSGQVSKVTVRGWNPRTKEAIIASADRNDLPGGSNGATSGPAAIERCLSSSGGREERSVDAPVTSEEEARQLAISLLRERAYEFITGTGRVMGLPDLRPGDNVRLIGLGERFTGLYYVKKVDHTLGNSGYLTQFAVRKYVEGDVA